MLESRNRIQTAIRFRRFYERFHPESRLGSRLVGGFLFGQRRDRSPSFVGSWMLAIFAYSRKKAKFSKLKEIFKVHFSQWSILSLNLPHVAGYRAIDVWFIVCILFVGLTLVELLIVIRCSPKKNRVSDVEMVVLDYPSLPPVRSQKDRALSESEPSDRRMSIIKPQQRKYTKLSTKSDAARAGAKDSHYVRPVLFRI